MGAASKNASPPPYGFPLGRPNSWHPTASADRTIANRWLAAKKTAGESDSGWNQTSGKRLRTVTPDMTADARPESQLALVLRRHSMDVEVQLGDLCAAERCAQLAEEARSSCRHDLCDLLIACAADRETSAGVDVEGLSLVEPPSG